MNFLSSTRKKHQSKDSHIPQLNQPPQTNNGFPEISVNPDTFTFTPVNLMIFEFLPTPAESAWISNSVSDASTVLEDCATDTQCSRCAENDSVIASISSNHMPSL